MIGSVVLLLDQSFTLEVPRNFHENCTMTPYTSD